MPQHHDHSGRPATNSGLRQSERAHRGHDHGAMVADYKRRFWVSVVLSVPVLALSETIQMFVGLDEPVFFAGSDVVVLVLSSIVYFYGAWPFLKGIAAELRARRPGMMTLIAIAITAAYVFSTLVVLGLPGMPFFWELVTLIDAPGSGANTESGWKKG